MRHIAVCVLTLRQEDLIISSTPLMITSMGSMQEAEAGAEAPTGGKPTDDDLFGSDSD
jgi:hypothetical protein